MTTAPKAQPELPPPLPVISEALFGTVPIRRGPVLGDGGHLHMDNATKLEWCKDFPKLAKRIKPLPAVACKLSPFLHLYEYKDLDTPKILAHWKTFTSQLTVVVDKLYDLPVDSNDLMHLRFLHRQAYLELIRTEQKKRSLTAQLKRPFDFS